MNAVVIIPARYDSSRFPGKPLVSILGKTLIQRVWSQCTEAFNYDDVFVATDDERIRQHCEEHDMQCIMTPSDCLTGTDRVAQAYKKIDGDYTTVINVQGDEPLVDPEDILKVASTHYKFPNIICCGTCELKLGEFENPNIVKVVINHKKDLVYASRAGVPTNKKLEFQGGNRQVCIYAFSPFALSNFNNKKRTPLESVEDIELLRFLEMGYDVKMVDVSGASIPVDIPEDIEKVENVLKGDNGGFLEKVRKEISSTIGVDMDGVIHKNSKGYHDGTIYDDPLPGTKEALYFLSKKYKLIIYTCKANPERPLVNGKTGIELIWEWLKKYNLDQFINEITDKKPRAAFYIDDKAIKFNTWEEALKDVEKFEKDLINDLSKF